MLVPNQATQISQQGPYVYVVKPDDTVELRPVTLGQRQGDDVVVTKGVADGERVVVTGQLTLMPGAKVHVQDAGAASGGARARRLPTYAAVRRRKLPIRRRNLPIPHPRRNLRFQQFR